MSEESVAQTVQGDESSTGKWMTGSEAVILSLLEEGVDVIFGYPGGAIMPIYDAMYHYEDKIRHILTRHEQGATHAAEGYARILNKAGVCFATSGPGATNLVTGLADAMMDSSPMVCITGQVPSHLLGTDAFQETDIIGITAPVTKWNYQITDASEIPEVIAKAFYIANTGKPGPVLIDITKDAQFNEFEYKPCKVSKLPFYTPKQVPKLRELKQAANLINSAKKPLILCGHGVLIAHAEEAFAAFVDKTGIPVGSTLQGLGAFDPDHALNVGMLGMHGNYGPNVKTNECDVMIAIGMRFDDRVTGNVEGYAKQARIIHIEIDSAEINKVVDVELGICADAKDALEALMPLVDQKEYPEWLEEFAECDRLEHAKIINNDLHPDSGEIRMGEIMHLLSKKTKGGAIIVPDVGQHQMAAARYYDYRVPDSWVSSGGLGTMGFSLPAAFGAKVAAPHREVIAIIGDGSFQMTVQELATIWQNKLPVKIVIFNNNFLGMVRQWQQLFFDRRYSSVNLMNPDFVAISKGFGIEAEKVENRTELDGALDRLLKSEESYLLEIMVEKEENVFPMVPSGSCCAEIRLE
ncbi:MAG: biosynthetic-type acetolactate synthase large subunit [Bacteroidetes bacterium]|nr:biosynthetic-type acetolactate synthase large subunit [Bacteroidota bacterium]